MKVCFSHVADVIIQARNGLNILASLSGLSVSFADFTGTRAKKSDQISFEGRLLGILVPKLAVEVAI